jgi:hypothetical protein
MLFKRKPHCLLLEYFADPSFPLRHGLRLS